VLAEACQHLSHQSAAVAVWMLPQQLHPSVTESFLAKILEGIHDNLAATAIKTTKVLVVKLHL
jgi:hypothetical protein